VHRLDPGLKPGLQIRIPIDPHYFGELDLDLDLNLSQNSGALEAQNGWVVNAYSGGMKHQNEALEGL
jgi:hypothetical protein